MENILLKDHAQIQFMVAIISNTETMDELKQIYYARKNPETSFQKFIARLGLDYANAMIETRNENKQSATNKDESA